VRGKRGNIVQVYPAVEYDFTPTETNLSSSKNGGDILHIQWTGSNTHLNGPPGGDGQTGNDGQGAQATDRNNLVQLASLGENFPLPFESVNVTSEMWSEVTVVGVVDHAATKSTDNSGSYLLAGQQMSGKDAAVYLATAGYYQCQAQSVCGARSYEAIGAGLDGDLNSANASLPGVLVKFTQAGAMYYFMCSRNNNFSNRSQKGSLVVT
jgi:hypothetical protein